jgi:predicted nucleic acid-binding protein
MSENLLYVVDTHVLIWYFTGSNRLNREIKNRIDEVRLQGGRLLIPTIVRIILASGEVEPFSS